MNDGVFTALAVFDLGSATAAPVFVARGAQGSVWKTSTETGTYAVKLLQPWVQMPALPFDVVVQQAAIKNGIPLPKPVLTPDGRAVVNGLRVYEWVDLAEVLHAPVSPSRAAEAGELLGRIHRLGVPSDGEPDPWYLTPPSREAWQQLLDDADSRGVDSPWIDEVREDLAFLLEVGERYRVEGFEPLITCHLDFAPDNVRPGLDGRLVVLDWENAGPLAPDGELAGALVDWTVGIDGTVDLEAARCLHQAYGGDVEITPQSFAMQVVTGLNYLRVLIENLVYEFDGSDPNFAEAVLPMVAPNVLRRRLGAIAQLVGALST